jgi:hypothetical protein
MQENEYWKRIPGFNKKYYASNLGRIMSAAHAWEKNYKGRIIKLNQSDTILNFKSTTKKGYFRTNLKENNGRSKTYMVHRLIALTFLGEIPINLQVNHINGIKTDNSIYNLEYVTNQQNRDHAKENKLIANRDKGFGKINNQQVLEIKKLYQEGLKQREIADIYKVCQQTISIILKD